MYLVSNNLAKNLSHRLKMWVRGISLVLALMNVPNVYGQEKTPPPPTRKNDSGTQTVRKRCEPSKNSFAKFEGILKSGNRIGNLLFFDGMFYFISSFSIPVTELHVVPDGQGGAIGCGVLPIQYSDKRPIVLQRCLVQITPVSEGLNFRFTPLPEPFNDPYLLRDVVVEAVENYTGFSIYGEREHLFMSFSNSLVMNVIVTDRCPNHPTRLIYKNGGFHLAIGGENGTVIVYVDRSNNKWPIHLSQKDIEEVYGGAVSGEQSVGYGMKSAFVRGFFYGYYHTNSSSQLYPIFDSGGASPESLSSLQPFEPSLLPGKRELEIPIDMNSPVVEFLFSSAPNSSTTLLRDSTTELLMGANRSFLNLIACVVGENQGQCVLGIKNLRHGALDNCHVISISQATTGQIMETIRGEIENILYGLSNWSLEEGINALRDRFEGLSFSFSKFEESEENGIMLTIRYGGGNVVFKISLVQEVFNGEKFNFWKVENNTEGVLQ